MKKTSYGLCRKTKPTPPERQLDFSDKKFAKKVAKDLLDNDQLRIQEVFNECVVKISGLDYLLEAVVKNCPNDAYERVMHAVGCCTNLESMVFDGLDFCKPQMVSSLYKLKNLKKLSCNNLSVPDCFENDDDENRLALIFSRLEELEVCDCIKESAMDLNAKWYRNLNLKSLRLGKRCSKAPSFVVSRLLRRCTKLEYLSLFLMDDKGPQFPLTNLIGVIKGGSLKSLKTLDLIVKYQFINEEECDAIRENCPELANWFMRSTEFDKSKNLALIYLKKQK